MTLSLGIRYGKNARLASLTECQRMWAMLAVKNLLASEERGNLPRRYQSSFVADLPGSEDLFFLAIFGVRIVYRRDASHVTIVSIEIEPLQPPPGGGGDPIKGGVSRGASPRPLKLNL